MREGVTLACRVSLRHRESGSSHAFVAPSKNSKSASQTRHSSVSETQLPSYFSDHTNTLQISSPQARTYQVSLSCIMEVQRSAKVRAPGWVKLCFCSCLQLLPQLACSIHATWSIDFSRSPYRGLACSIITIVSTHPNTQQDFSTSIRSSGLVLEPEG